MNLNEAVQVVGDYLGVTLFVSKNCVDPIDYGRGFIAVRDKSGMAQVIIISSGGKLIPNGSPWVEVENIASR